MAETKMKVDRWYLMGVHAAAASLAQGGPAVIVPDGTEAERVAWTRGWDAVVEHQADDGEERLRLIGLANACVDGRCLQHPSHVQTHRDNAVNLGRAVLDSRVLR